MLFDTVKSRMQFLQYQTQYKSSLDYAFQIARSEGIRAFWSASFAKNARLTVSRTLTLQHEFRGLKVA